MSKQPRPFVDKIAKSLMNDYSDWDLEYFNCVSYTHFFFEDDAPANKTLVRLQWTIHPRVDMIIKEPSYVKLTFREKKLLWNSIVIAREMRLHDLKFR